MGKLTRKVKDHCNYKINFKIRSVNPSEERSWRMEEILFAAKIILGILLMGTGCFLIKIGIQILNMFMN